MCQGWDLSDNDYKFWIFFNRRKQIPKHNNIVLDILKYSYHKIDIKTEHSNKWASVWLPYCTT